MTTGGYRSVFRWLSDSFRISFVMPKGTDGSGDGGPGDDVTGQAYQMQDGEDCFRVFRDRASRYGRMLPGALRFPIA